MFLYKDNRFHFSNISFCLPDNVYLNTNCEEYKDSIELRPISADFRIIIYGDYSNEGAKQFFLKDEETCYRYVSDVETVAIGNVIGYSRSFNSTHNSYAEYRFDIDGDKNNIFGILVHAAMQTDINTVIKHPAIEHLLQSLKTE